MPRLALVLLALSPAALEACPDLRPYHPGADPDWARLAAELRVLSPECLESPEYFALLGAARLYSGRLSGAIESLERALLLDPDHGAALVDYAEALLRDGQLFAALEINGSLLEREDLPSGLAARIADRQSDWRGLTRRAEWQLDLLAGHDSNLNGAPDRDAIALTLSGESVLLPLIPEFQAVEGPYLNARTAGSLRRLGPDSQHAFGAELRVRTGEDSAHDLVNLGARYGYIRPGRGGGGLLFDAGVSHLAFSGNSLYTGSSASLRRELALEGRCRPFYGATAQHQLWHGQSRLNGLEAKLGAGADCAVGGAANQRVSGEVGALRNAALKPRRPGGDRRGWQLSLDWRLALPRGTVTARFSHTRLEDREGYSPLLAGGARRDTRRSALQVQYRERVAALGEGAWLLVSAYHQRQDSNIELFQTENTIAEVGLSWRF